MFRKIVVLLLIVVFFLSVAPVFAQNSECPIYKHDGRWGYEPFQTSGKVVPFGSNKGKCIISYFNEPRPPIDKEVVISLMKYQNTQPLYINYSYGYDVKYIAHYDITKRKVWLLEDITEQHFVLKGKVEQTTLSPDAMDWSVANIEIGDFVVVYYVYVPQLFDWKWFALFPTKDIRQKRDIALIQFEKEPENKTPLPQQFKSI